jgi:hypothetical protein
MDIEISITNTLRAMIFHHSRRIHSQQAECSEAKSGMESAIITVDRLLKQLDIYGFSVLFRACFA